MKILARISHLFFFCLIFSCQGNTIYSSSQELTMYCAASMKPAVEQIAKTYQKEYGIKVNLQYGGSGTLLSNLTIVKRGDLYLAADESYMKNAVERGLVEETQPLVYLKPVIAVAVTNPHNIFGLNDLKSNKLRFAIANPDAASIGRITKKILTETGWSEELSPFIAVMKPTVNELANDIKIGSIDAAIIWDAVANQYPELEYISVLEWDRYKQQTVVGILKSSENKATSLNFLRYLSASNKGLATFSALGYNPIEGQLWKENTDR
jgi:molybdate transport system substrate-binding protein